MSETEKNKPENMSASNCDTANVGAKGGVISESIFTNEPKVTFICPTTELI